MNATNRSKKAHNGRNAHYVGKVTSTELVNDNAFIVIFNNGSFNVVYPALGMNQYMNDETAAMDMFNLINVAGLTVNELKGLGFGY